MQCQRLLSFAVSTALLITSGGIQAAAQTLRPRTARTPKLSQSTSPTAAPVQHQTVSEQNVRSPRRMRGSRQAVLASPAERQAAKVATAQRAMKSATAQNGDSNRALTQIESPMMPQAVAAPNDQCSNAAAISSFPLPAFSTTYDITNTTTDSSDPAIADACLSESSLNPTRSVWYTFTPDNSGAYFVSTCADAPTDTTVTDTLLNIYQGSCGSLTQLPTNSADGTAGCDDDGCLNDPESTFQSVLRANLTANTTYYILVRQLQAATTPQPIEPGKADLQLRIAPVGTARRPNPGEIIISEFRLSANGNNRDEFIELHNATNTPLDIGGGEYLVLSYDPALNISGGRPPEDGLVPVFISPGVILPARGYYLISNNADADQNGSPDSYSLNNYALPDNRITSLLDDYFIDNQGVSFVREVFTGTNSSTITVLDSVGFTNDQTQPNPPRFTFVEGAGLTNYTGPLSGEVTFVRRLVGGYPQDTNNNANDFLLLSATASPIGSQPTILGAASPQSQRSPRTRPVQAVSIRLLDTTRGTNESPNLVIDDTDRPLPGSLRSAKLRRRFTNTTGRPVTQLRIRIERLTTLGNRGGGESDARLFSSNDVTVTSADGARTFAVKGLTLDAPPSNISFGGGFNSTARVATVTLASPIPATGSNTVDVEIKFVVQSDGRTSYVYSVEGAN